MSKLSFISCLSSWTKTTLCIICPVAYSSYAVMQWGAPCRFASINAPTAEAVNTSPEPKGVWVIDCGSAVVPWSGDLQSLSLTDSVTLSKTNSLACLLFLDGSTISAQDDKMQRYNGFRKKDSSREIRIQNTAFIKMNQRLTKSDFCPNYIFIPLELLNVQLAQLIIFITIEL